MERDAGTRYMMKREPLKQIVLLFALVLVFLSGGCSLYEKYVGGGEEEKTPEELWNEGMAKFQKGNFEAATEAFQNIRDKYPYSKYALQAELKMADGLFKKGEMDEAYDAYDEFEKLHPKNPNIPYAIYQKGMCHMERMTTIDRDQSHTLTAKEEFERLVKRFPRTDYANMARKNIRKCLIYLSEHELYVGHHYFKMEKYRAAMDRYSYIITHYPDTGQYHEALEYIHRCKERLAQRPPDYVEDENPGLLDKINPFKKKK
jgi:outer membrane protein assembly factor BamD